MELSSFPSVLFFFFLFPLSIFAFFSFLYSSKKPTSEGLKPYPLLGHLPHFAKNRHRILEWTTEILIRNPTHSMGFHGLGQTSGILTANPANVEHILKANVENYPKDKEVLNVLQDFLGHGIFNSNGERWKEQRKTSSYEFNKRSLRNFVMNTVKQEIEERLLPLLRRAEEKEETVDLQDVLERFGFDNICKVAFNEDPGALAEQKKTVSEASSMDFGKAYGDVQDLILRRFTGDALPFIWRIRKLLNIGSEKRLKESISIVHDFAMNIIRSRKGKPAMLKEDEDLLSRFVANKENTEEYLRDNVINFIMAGRETTSSALTWFFWILSSRPDVEKKILEEVKSIRSATQNTSSETFSFDELREMHFLHSALTESIRLYPPVPIDSLTCEEDDVLPDGTFVGKGWFVRYSAFAMGRLEDIWGEDCNDYKPERWLDSNGVFKPESPFRFTAFHAGPRMCLGKEMSYIQMKSVVASMVEQFEIDAMADKDKPPEHVISPTLKMRKGLPVQVRKRN